MRQDTKTSALSCPSGPKTPLERHLHCPSDPIHTALECWQNERQVARLERRGFGLLARDDKCNGSWKACGCHHCIADTVCCTPHGTNRNTTYITGWNLDCAVTTLLISKVDPVLGPKQAWDSVYNERDRENWEAYDRVTFENAPISVQIVARTLQEEALIGMLEIVDKALRHFRKLRCTN